MREVVVKTDVSDVVGLGEPLHTMATVFLPETEALTDPPVICYGFPGGGYSRGYFSFDMPGASGSGQAGWHARRGWIFVACDHLHVGESASPRDPSLLTYENLAAANSRTVEQISAALAAGTVTGDYPPVVGATRLGIGQSMGGCLIIVAHGQNVTYDGIGVLGYSAIHTVLAVAPGTPPLPSATLPRGTTVSAAALVQGREGTFGASAGSSRRPTEADLPPATWGFHYDDEPTEVVVADMVGYPERPRTDPLPAWASRTIPPCAVTMMSPGAVAPEAATITVPVLVAVGERDVCPDPWMEPMAYKHATDITVFICPRMSHMHNFAGTRELFWARIHAWGTAVAALRNMSASAVA
jgi:pimeloyl-ACP methyl ester carboxylesterase